MLGFSRAKWVGIERPEAHIYLTHGILEDLIYGMEIDVSIRAPEYVITSIEGRMKRVTTPECPKALPVLQRAVGLCLTDPHLISIINRSVGREGCRHLANLLLECCDAVIRCALYEKWDDGSRGDEQSREKYLKERLEEMPFLKGSCRVASSL
ncbi:MAG: hypothetical protein JL50_17040 [Peptococcaceae bacterium BICA1-7]|nr:MAG: hypothetical protein JL50_17040 [Peptococcaceae bacterium BICA1-7]HBV96500.1 DUF2889 domain-containing protein [Desulfotomaculum sp.]